MKNKHLRATLLLVGALTLLVCLGLFCACDSGKTPDDTPALTDGVTNAPTEAIITMLHLCL